MTITPWVPIRRPAIRSRAIAAAIVIAAGSALGGCQGHMSPGLDETVLATVMDYQCEGGNEMRVERAPDARNARVTVGTRSWLLIRVDSAAQEKYSAGATSLYLEGEIATLESEGRLVGGKCQSKVPMPKAPTMRVNDMYAPTF